MIVSGKNEMLLNCSFNPSYVTLLAVVTILLLPYSTCAQSVTGTITFKKQDAKKTDSGSKIYLAHRNPGMHFDQQKVLQAEKMQAEYDLILGGTSTQRAKHKRRLARQFGISDSAEVAKYLAEAKEEEAKIIAASDMRLAITDSLGQYRFDNVSAGYYWVLIRSANTNGSACVAIDVAKNGMVVISRSFEAPQWQQRIQ